jgi:uncharacterized heparinase superfamily protein
MLLTGATRTLSRSPWPEHVRVGLYFDSIRRMRPRQVLARGRRLLPPAVWAAGTSRFAAPEWNRTAAGLGVDPAPQSGPLIPPDEVGEFTAFGATRRFSESSFWGDPSDDVLFRFYLHGFSPFAAYSAGPRTREGDAFWARVVESWLETHAKPNYPAWHPYPTSLRVIAWCAALSAIESWPRELQRRIAAELVRQGRYLRRAVEHDIGGNHVLKNATALAFVGCVIPSSGLLDPALRLLLREIPRQFLGDGGHEERSTSYHRAVLQDLRDIEELLRRRSTPAPVVLLEARALASSWQEALTGPDQRLPLLNDAWEGPRLGSASKDDVTELRETGYFVFRHSEDQAVFDAGALSPAHLPPHAHADALSFVLWGEGRPLVVDPGSYIYSGSWRDAFRGTAAHNTVEVDGADQCEFWGDFRLAYPPRIRVLPLRVGSGVTIATASHDGYQRLKDPVEHHRVFLWFAGKGIVVVDRLRAKHSHQIRSRLHVAPDAPTDGRTRVGSFSVTALGQGAAVRRIEGWYAPFLGHKVFAPVLEDARTVSPDDPFGWSLLREDWRVTRLELDRVDLGRPGEPPNSVPLVWS